MASVRVDYPSHNPHNYRGASSGGALAQQRQGRSGHEARRVRTIFSVYIFL